MKNIESNLSALVLFLVTTNGLPQWNEAKDWRVVRPARQVNWVCLFAGEGRVVTWQMTMKFAALQTCFSCDPMLQNTEVLRAHLVAKKFYDIRLHDSSGTIALCSRVPVTVAYLSQTPISLFFCVSLEYELVNHINFFKEQKLYFIDTLYITLQCVTGF